MWSPMRPWSPVRQWSRALAGYAAIALRALRQADEARYIRPRHHAAAGLRDERAA
jgi:hypothetical protein